MNKLSKLNKTIFFKVLFLLSIILIIICCFIKKKDPHNEIENLQAGTFTDLEDGRIYLPLGWNCNDINKWPVTIVLHGFGELSRSLSQRPIWKDSADELGIVLFFVETGHMGWYEKHNSEDTKIIIKILKAFRKKPWVKENNIQLFGWSAGAIMVMGFNALNKKQSDSKPLFDKLATISGGFGIIMEKEVKKNPKLKKSIRIPAFICWGEKEPNDHGKDAAQYLKNQGWRVETMKSILPLFKDLYGEACDIEINLISEILETCIKNKEIIDCDTKRVAKAIITIMDAIKLKLIQEPEIKCISNLNIKKYLEEVIFPISLMLDGLKK